MDLNDSKCNLCRRAGEKLFLKGDRCFGPKCAIIRRNYPPGVHGPQRAGKQTPYGLQLREKQKAKAEYGLRERQMKNYYSKAKQVKGDTARILLGMLESRLDNIVFRLGLAKSRSQARQLVGHRHILVNGKILNIPSAQIKNGVTISIKPATANLPVFQTAKESLERHEAPNWIKLNAKELSGQVVADPAAEDMKTNFDIKAIIEFYSR